MGKPDSRQPKLVFDAKKTVTSSHTEEQAQNAEDSSQAQSSTSDDEVKTLLLAMQQSLTALSGKMDMMNTRLDFLVLKVDKHDEQLKEAKRRISDTEDTTSQLHQQMSHMDKLLKVIASKNENLEARSRRNNIRVIGISENTNTGRMDDYAERLLCNTFGASAFSPHLTVERAHRSLGPRPPPGGVPRPIIARLLNYRDRDTALRMAREKILTYEGMDFTMYPDFTAAVQEARRKFLPVKQKLRKVQIDFALMYPARLRITHQGKQSVFVNPQQAEEFLKRVNRHSPLRNSDDRSPTSRSPEIDGPP